MPKIVEEIFYDEAKKKLLDYGLGPLLTEVRKVLTGFTLKLKEAKHANGAAAIAEMLDDRFKAAGWQKGAAGQIDWMKTVDQPAIGVKVGVGVEIQVSGRSDSGLIQDIYHLRLALREGRIEVAIMVVPSKTMAYYLPSRVATAEDARRHLQGSNADTLPFVVFVIEHDGKGAAIPKKERTPRDMVKEE